MATENSGAPHLPPSWPEVPASWPETRDEPGGRQGRSTSPGGWPEATPGGWPEVPGRESQQGGRPADPFTDRLSHDPFGTQQPVADPFAPSNGRPEPAPEAPRDPLPAWSNLSSPAPWPPAGDQPVPQPPQGEPMDRTLVHPQPEQNRPGANLSRDPSDPDRPFVTAGQISGSRTPPPERQQELWNTVFGENDDDGDQPEERRERRPRRYEPEDDEQGKPVWVFALAGTVAVGLVGALLWAFLAGPLAAEQSEPVKTPQPPPKAQGSQPPPATKPSFPKIKRYPGTPAPVAGTLADTVSGISVPRLGGTWQLDQRPAVKNTYGYETRQFSAVGAEGYAHVMTSQLPERMSGVYDQENLEPAIKSVVVDARKRFFPRGNTVRKVGQQAIKRGTSTGLVIAYELTSSQGKATIAAAALNTGGALPGIVYMSVPEEAANLLPDINTVLRQLKSTNPA
jgi:hypothetical protein